MPQTNGRTVAPGRLTNGAASAVTAELQQISAEALADPALIDPAFLDAIRMSRRRQRLARTLLPVPAPSGRARTTWVGDLQQGDGGKGAMTDRLARVHHAVVRVQGGDNAGHTTVFTDTQGNDVVVKNHVIPSGLRQPTTIGIIGNGMLINAQRLADELQALSPVMADLSDRVFVSDRAHLILPLHRVVDATQEDAKELTGRAVGTTRRGIGPANVSKVNRIGIRVGDLSDWSVVTSRVTDNITFFGLGAEHIDVNLSWLADHTKMLLDRAVDSIRLIDDLVSSGYSVLFEGAQGPLIDLERGIYPYVTTSPTAIHSVASGGGFDISRIDHRIGVLKVYQTMVGNGAFVSEDHADVGQQLRLKGEEFGTTTGRSRRCGWLDLLQARWAVDVNHFTSVVLTKLDVLDTFERIGVCVAYELDGRIIAEFEPDHDQLCRCRPVYRYFDGWLSSTRHVATYDALPDRAREFVDFIADHLGVEVGAVTKGPRDSDMLVRLGSDLARAHEP